MDYIVLKKQQQLDSMRFFSTKESAHYEHQPNPD